MPKITRRTKFLIVGAGAAGLCFAQMLRKEGLDFEIFERDEGKRSKGWLFGLDVCLTALERLLPDGLETISSTSPNSGLGVIDSFGVLDSQSGEIIGTTTSKNSDGIDRGYMVSREKLRQALMKGLNVQIGKYVTHYEEHSNGVTVYFRDGTSSRGDVLVAADGSNSTIRHQLLNGFQATPSSYIIIHGNTTLTRTQYQPILEHGTIGLLASEDGLKSYITILEYNEDGTGVFNWGVAYRTRDRVKENEWARRADGEELFEKALSKISHLPNYFVDTVKATGPDGMQVPPIRLLETELPRDMHSGGCVTLMGDAAHSMVPFKGMGANTAILDACDLLEFVVDGIEKGSATEEVLRAYEDIIVPRGRALVLESREVGERGAVSEIAGGRAVLE